MNTLPTPAMKALPEVNRWLLLEPWGFEVKPDKDNSQNWNGPKIFLVPQGLYGMERATLLIIVLFLFFLIGAGN